MDLIKSNHNCNLSDEEKQIVISNATEQYGKFLTALGFDWQTDIQMKDTPKRVAKMYVTELFKGTF